MDEMLERAWTLKQNLIDFVLDAEGELAVALEAYAAARSTGERYDIAQQNQVIDSFTVEGKVGDKTPIDLFVESQPDLTEGDRSLLESWRHRSFTGLFEITQLSPDKFELMNWLTAKHYVVKPNSPNFMQEMSRFKLGEILLARIAPLTDDWWILSSSPILMGKLGKPKLAVAIGNFKQNNKKNLYSDAPELLEQAWQSVEKYHEDFTEFFGSDELTLSGYHLNKQLTEFQEFITKKRLADIGIDESKSLADIVEDAGVDAEEIKAAAIAAAGADPSSVEVAIDSNPHSKMVMPKVELPDRFKKAEQVTALSHPRWGQTFLSTYAQLTALLAAEDFSTVPGYEKLVRNYLEDPGINVWIWQRLAKVNPAKLEQILQTVLQRTNFQLDRDLDALLQEFKKPLEPELPEIASVPVHLHNLFQEALGEVNKSKSKPQDKKKSSKGFKS
ncbi:hypothetical protein NDA07_03755 [Microcoleus vaginatus DQ-U2]|uniref:hypothetical protein n=1 Tax=Microcoleus vaginatus TaxID=119532 RepID=UPI001684C82E|nr:hypothetical protein [Microcoleus sp. FACHB-DQ6]